MSYFLYVLSNFIHILLIIFFTSYSLPLAIVLEMSRLASCHFAVKDAKHIHYYNYYAK